MRTQKVRRNSKELQQMWGRTTSAKSYTLDNYFIGQDISVDGCREHFDRYSELVKVFRTESGYTLHYHSNDWVELKVAS